MQYQNVDRFPLPPSKKRKCDNSAHALSVFTITTFDSMTDNELDFLKFFDYVRPFIFEELQSKLEEKRAIKWYAVVQATLTRTTQENDVECITSHFRSNCVVELMENTIAEHLESAFKKNSKFFRGVHSKRFRLDFRKNFEIRIKYGKISTS
ncbi:uncharacterized protein NPIL_565351 [Nephila pilipes]|uniref:Uncharacterized protein n=1 Tax=Nephila pilipes TaxID=299642 RepID=A0A8X6Q4C1_NEPPI|nr:uncharacterized protein NPIL_565351 [Nephila pilipes]